ncbi:MAG: hypothetical protein MR209_02410 [Veillonellaceae bacterium]|nr:hypothetical protein [Veillonellaceae bacterium]
MDDVLMRLVPELFEEAERRYVVLKQISLHGPVGRRAVADATGYSERVVRGQVVRLEQNALVEVSPVGIRTTRKGERLLVGLAEFFRARQSLQQLGEELAERLGMTEVRIVRGDSSRQESVQANMAQEGALLVAGLLAEDAVLAVSGGMTLALLAKAFPETPLRLTVVPARGGFGERLEAQANAVAATIARKTGGNYHMLHVPDGFSPQVIDLLRREDANLREVEALIHRADILVTGIGEAQRMAEQRQLAGEERELILASKAVGEALGYYARADGSIVHCRPNVGLTLAELANVPEIVLVAGGSRKAGAILAMAQAGVRGRLVTDEGAAKAIQKELRKTEETDYGNKNRH